MIKCGTAIRTGTASTDAFLRRFTRAASHPNSSASSALVCSPAECNATKCQSQRQDQRLGGW